MSNAKIFSNDWRKLRSPKEKKAQLIEKLGGLHPAVLVVDDEPDFLEVIKDLFESLGVDCYCAEKPTDAIGIIDRFQARLLMIICDYRMPEMNGLEWRKKSKEKSGDIPFVILSGFVDREMALEALALKISAFVEKPASEEKMLDLLADQADAYAAKLGEDYELLKSFIDDADSLLEQIEELFLELEEHPQDMGLINQAYGLLHTMKGNAGFFEPRTLHEFAHRFEDEIKGVQTGDKVLTSQALSQWLKGLDILKVLVKEFKDSSHQPRRLDQLAQVFFELPNATSASISDDSSEPAAQTDEARTQNADDKDIKVSIRLLDGFMQVSGEMTVIRNMINKTAQSLERRYSADKDVQLLSELLGEMHKINSDIQNKVNDLRRVSVTSLLRPLTRAARDSAKALNKEIDLKIEGQNLRVDHSLAEIISRTLIHLIRNSVDHGLENSEQRVVAKKPSKGTLKLTFLEKEDEVQVEVSDDGKGIDPNVIAKKCLEKGIRTPSELKTMTDKQIQMMIFEAGFSTAEKTTQFSGRGVGMSMVKESVEAIGGQLVVDSEVGRGSRIQMRLPIPRSALIEPCLFIQINRQSYALPQQSIVRVLRPEDLREDEWVNAGDRQFLRLEGQLLPIVDSRTALGLPLGESKADSYVIVLQFEAGQFGLLVDQIFDIEDTVVKTFSVENLKTLPTFKGGTFLADGRVGLVLNVEGLAQSCHLADGSAHHDIENGNEAVEVGSPQTMRYLTFSLADHEVYALEENKILRIEQLAWADLQKSGGEGLIPYRDGLLHLLDLGRVFEKDCLISVNWQEPRDPLWVVLLRHSGCQVGLIVNKIIDLEEISGEVEPSAMSSQWVSGLLLKEQSCRTLIDTTRILQELQPGLEGPALMVESETSGQLKAAA